jgi:hypothetical protein
METDTMEISTSSDQMCAPSIASSIFRIGQLDSSPKTQCYFGRKTLQFLAAFANQGSPARLCPFGVPPPQSTEGHVLCINPEADIWKAQTEPTAVGRENLEIQETSFDVIASLEVLEQASARMTRTHAYHLSRKSTVSR